MSKLEQTLIKVEAEE